MKPTTTPPPDVDGVDPTRVEPPHAVDVHHGIIIGRYMLHRQIARGGMATIHIARLMGDEGFSRIVAAKRLHPEFAEDAEFVQMFLDEARIASKVHHRNVVPVLDVVTTGDEVVIVQEYVHGVPLHWLLRTAHEAKTHVPINVAVSIACQVLAGLHAAHETCDEMGTPLNIVHRDVSPQNIMVSTDGTARLLDFGVAKATMAAHVTRDGTFKGKLAYSAPEQIRGKANRQSDVYSLSVVLWELIVGHRMHGSAQAEAELVGEIMSGSLPTVTDALAVEREWLGNNRWKQLEMLEPIIMKGLDVDAKQRFQAALDMEAALASAVTPASPTGVAAWLKALGKAFLEGRDRVIAEEEASWRRNALSSAPRRLSSEVRAVPVATHPGNRPASGERTSRRAWLPLAGLASAVALALTITIFVLVHSSGDRSRPAPPAASVAPPLPAPAVAPPAPPPTAVAKTVAIDPPAPVPPPAATDSQPVDPPTTEPRVAASRAVAATPRPRMIRPIARPAPHLVAPPPTPAAPPPAPAAAPTATPATPATDCNPPYYYEGSKKVFKPACV